MNKQPIKEKMRLADLITEASYMKKKKLQNQQLRLKVVMKIKKVLGT